MKRGAVALVAGTQTVTATPVDVATPTPSTTSTATAKPAPTDTATPTSSPTVSDARCLGNCDGDRTVNVSELVLVIDIALGASPAEECPAVEAGMLTIDVLVAAIAHALDGCPG